MTPVRAADLDGRYYSSFERTPVVLFESAEEVERWRLDQGKFPYEDHLYRYSRADGLAREPGWRGGVGAS